ncbi:hypothetical protein [uncultured Sulfitobacter sp.]|uniref:hypothetical protein n=1 Tax=uncultured Sulfitobacter sp. TaxID=191468 RepID=UPI00260B701B|nr:hypothetical protein [uncultured Sulfitobacter sp.]
MAEALTIVGEAGIHGMEHNGLISSQLDDTQVFQSKRFRFSCTPAYQFHGKEFEDYMILAYRFGFVIRSKYKEVERHPGLERPSYQIESEIVRLTQIGWEYLEEHNKPLLHGWWLTTLERVPHGITSIVTAALTTWAILHWGAPK